MTWAYVLLAILGIAVLMIVHEGGHHLAARAFKMRVLRFSIGFGPAIWRHQPKGSDTVYQVALIPFLAYVQIAGMNPLEEVDPDDEGSYANASLIGRITTIFAGPLANYLFASVLFFAAFMVGGDKQATMQLDVMEGGAAEAAGVRDGDLVQRIEGRDVAEWEDLRRVVLANPNRPIEFEVERDGKPMTILVTPAPDAKGGQGQIKVQPVLVSTPMDTKKAAWNSIVYPFRLAGMILGGIGKMIAGKAKPDLAGPVGIGKEITKAAKRSAEDYLSFLGLISTSLAIFNMLPIPALDGGRLMFLGYEAVTRRRPNAKIEAHIHFVGLVMLLALFVVVSVMDIQR